MAGGGLTRDFQLENGARIEGFVKAQAATTNVAAGEALPGIKILLRDYQTFFPIGASKVKWNGGYRINVIPGDYAVIARNTSKHPYATAVHDYTTRAEGARNRNKAKRVSVTAGGTTKINFGLIPGKKIYGRLLAADGTTPLIGRVVRVNIRDGSFGTAARLRTNLQGYYRIWLKPRTDYQFQMYGHGNIPDPVSAASLVDIFTTSKEINYTQDVDYVDVTVVDGSMNPLSQVKLQLRADTGSKVSYVDFAVTGSDGTARLYAAANATHYLFARVDDNRPHGTSIYNVAGAGVTNIASATSLVFGGTAGTNFGAVTMQLPAGIQLSGTVTKADGSSAKAARHELYDGSTASYGDYYFHVDTRGDGTYSVSVPDATKTYVAKVKHKSLGVSLTEQSVPVTAGTAATKNYTFN